MVNINNVFPSKYLSSQDLDGGERTLTIKDVRMETFADNETKPIVYFDEIDKGLTLNKTNATTIGGLFGPETDDWLGQRVTLFAIWTEFQGRQTQGLRVRAPTRQLNQSHQRPLEDRPQRDGAREYAAASGGSFDERNPPPAEYDRV